MNKNKHKKRHHNPSGQNKQGQHKGQKRKFHKHRRVHADQHLNDEIRAILKDFRYATNTIRSYVVHCTEEQLGLQLQNNRK